MSVPIAPAPGVRVLQQNLNFVLFFFFLGRLGAFLVTKSLDRNPAAVRQGGLLERA